VPKLSVTIITLNEAEHVASAIESAAWADEIIVVDSGSTDATVDIARGEGARVLTRDWTGYVDQKNFAAEASAHDWIFSLDADERIPPALADEIKSVMRGDPPMHGYRVPRVSYHLGRWIRTTDFYPDYQTRLYHRRFARWRGRYVHESVAVDGPSGRLKNDLEHYSFSDLSDQVQRLNYYTTLAALQMHEAGRRTGPLEILAHPPAAFLRNYVLRRGFMDGTAGLMISLINAWSVMMKFMKLWEMQRNPRLHISPSGSHPTVPAVPGNNPSGAPTQSS
jgi:glycosyltransferase involved in cell wall biosynthesis